MDSDTKVRVAHPAASAIVPLHSQAICRAISTLHKEMMSKMSDISALEPAQCHLTITCLVPMFTQYHKG